MYIFENKKDKIYQFTTKKIKIKKNWIVNKIEKIEKEK